MTKEEIIRNEADNFYNWELNEDEPISLFHEIKNRLSDFYSSESKAIFLDEIKAIIQNDLIKHRMEKHDGKASSICQYEKNIEKLVFYIHQELGTLPYIANQNLNINSKHKRNKVFVSYSHVDKEFLVDIKRHFKPFLSQIDFWDDSKILPGQKWKKEISDAINLTKVAILLVSTDFLGSDFISNNELPALLKAARKDGASILIVIIKPCLFEVFPSLNQYQALNQPNNPVIKMTYAEKEDLWVNLVRQTKRLLQK